MYTNLCRTSLTLVQGVPVQQGGAVKTHRSSRCDSVRQDLRQISPVCGINKTEGLNLMSDLEK